MGINRLECKVYNLQPSSTEVKNTWRCDSTLSPAFTAWYLIKHRDYLYLSVSCYGLARTLKLCKMGPVLCATFRTLPVTENCYSPLLPAIVRSVFFFEKVPGSSSRHYA
jgi:hypothetical protein